MRLLSKIENSMRAHISRELPSQGLVNSLKNPFLTIGGLAAVVLYILYFRGKDVSVPYNLLTGISLLAGVKLLTFKRQYPVLFASFQGLFGLGCAFINLFYTPIFARPAARVLILAACAFAVMKSQEAFDAIYEREHQSL